MNIQHFEKDFHFTDAELLLAARKIGKLATLCRRMKDEGSWIRLEVEKRGTKKTKDEIKVTVIVHLPKKMLSAESRRSDVIDALDRCIDKLEPQVKKYKELHTGRGQTQRKDLRKKNS